MLIFTRIDFYQKHNLVFFYHGKPYFTPKVTFFLNSMFVFNRSKWYVYLEQYLSLLYKPHRLILFCDAFKGLISFYFIQLLKFYLWKRVRYTSVILNFGVYEKIRVDRMQSNNNISFKGWYKNNIKERS